MKNKLKKIILHFGKKQKNNIQLTTHQRKEFAEILKKSFDDI